ncbi:hypothetical protein ACW180_03290 [Limosilactobacillus fermentum]
MHTNWSVEMRRVRGVGEFNSKSRTFGGRLLDVGMFKLEGRHEEVPSICSPFEVLVLAEENAAVE